MTSREYERAVAEVQYEGRRFARLLPLAAVGVLAWLAVLYAVRPVGSSALKFALLIVVCPAVAILLVIKRARRMDVAAARVGLRCPQCGRWLWASQMREHLAATGSCRNCGFMIVEDFPLRRKHE